VENNREADMKKDASVFQEIALSKIKTNPLNPRRRGFEGQAFDELVASIISKGVLQPVLVRPKSKGFELVAGERRFKACCAIAEANGGMKAATIPAMVRDLDDEAAFDVMMIENPQREDPSELEEAEGFKAWLDKRGPDSLEDLAQRTGIHPGYIRRRVALLELPDKALKAWDKGELKYGHLEVLIRIQDKKQRAEFLAHELEGGWTAKELRRRIDSESPSLKKALFDPDQGECPQCFHNTDKQKSLFALDDIAGAACMKPACFKQKQNNWLSANWKASELRRKFKTNGFRFEDVSNRSATGESFYQGDKVFVECKACDKFVSLIGIDGDPIHGHCGRFCLDPKCKSALEAKDRAAKTKQKKHEQQLALDGESGETDGEPQAEEPRVSWHGEFFRERFYETALPPRILDLDPMGEQALRLAILSMINLSGYNCDLKGIMQKYLGIKKQHYMSGDQVIQALAYPASNLAALLLHLSQHVIMSGSTTSISRRAVAEHIGIDLAKEWRITDEYLQKKTKAEILEIGEKCGVFRQEVVQSYLFEKLLKKRGKFDACKKPELVELFLKSGADLAGVVPEEILRKPDPRSSLYDEEEGMDDPTCRVCGCTEDDCSECVAATGEPCHWVEPDLCSRCAPDTDHTQAVAATKAA
jgi:ParB family transcriptional regulator, chromosome partitioning protein